MWFYWDLFSKLCSCIWVAQKVSFKGQERQYFGRNADTSANQWEYLKHILGEWMSCCVFFKIWLPEFEEMLFHFYVHCGFGSGFLLDSTGLSWELHGPHTAVCPEHVLASAHLPRHQVWEEGGTRQRPPVTLWISTVQQLDEPGTHPFVISRGWE